MQCRQPEDEDKTGDLLQAYSCLCLEWDTQWWGACKELLWQPRALSANVMRLAKAAKGNASALVCIAHVLVSGPCLFPKPCVIPYQNLTPPFPFLAFGYFISLWGLLCPHAHPWSTLSPTIEPQRLLHVFAFLSSFSPFKARAGVCVCVCVCLFCPSCVCAAVVGGGDGWFVVGDDWLVVGFIQTH